MTVCVDRMTCDPSAGALVHAGPWQNASVRITPPGVEELGDRLATLGWVSDLFVGGSVATDDYTPGISDIDLVALVDGPVDTARQSTLMTLHRALDDGIAADLKLGCVYVADAQLLDLRAVHPTWTHGSLVDRILSGVARAELVRCGYAVLGRSPLDVLPVMSDDDVREAVRGKRRAPSSRVLDVGGSAALAMARPSHRGPGAYLYGPRSSHAGDGRTAHQGSGRRARRRSGLVGRPAPGQTQGRARPLASHARGPDRLARRPPNRRPSTTLSCPQA